MKRKKLIFSVIALALIGGTALLLAAVPQRLGPPGIKASPVPGSARWQIHLPANIPGYNSADREPDAKSLEMLPADTSIADKVYSKLGAFPIFSGVVLMGTDRTSIHKAQYCLLGQGVHIDQMTTDVVHMSQPQPYDLPVIKILGTGSQIVNGKTNTFRCLYLYWYVSDTAISNDQSGMGRMWSMAKQLAFTGVLQRWAYVRFYTLCEPGQEDAALAQVKDMIAAAVPEFQLFPKTSNAAMAAQR